jgi:hypothetical protein
MVEYGALDEYSNGWKAIRGDEVFYASGPSDERIEFGSSSVGPNRRRVRAFTALCVKYGELPKLDDPELVPTDVAIGGKEEIAAYLLAVHRDAFTPEDAFKPTELATRLDISYDTIRAYCRRVINSVSDRKVGGIAR